MTVPPKPFFVVSCARSGSTSLTRILDLASNGGCALEPAPNLNRETRDMMDGRLVDPDAVLRSTVVPRAREGMAEGRIYGEKNVTYGPFLDRLYRELDCRFVFLRRDGRDVVRSLMDWHERMFGSIYRECHEMGNLSERALAAAAKLPGHLDTSDYSRPRPLAGEPLAAEWEHLSREEMCAYYWSRSNREYRAQLARIPASDWIELDYTNVDSDRILEVVEFLGLEGVEGSAVRESLESRVNSLGDRIGESNKYPAWTHWDSGMRDRFWRIAGPAMTELGFVAEPAAEWRPAEYGQWWIDHEGGIDWYEWMFESRERVHRDLIDWVSADDSIRSIVDFGCGLEVGYCDAFAERRYVGIDLSPNNVEWCRQNRDNPLHDHRCVDFVTQDLGERFDLVTSSGTIDNSYDVDESLRAMVRASRGWIHATCYRGWFPELDEHRYTYESEHQCFYNDVSPSRMRRTLEAVGCTEISIEPIPTGNEAIPQETRVRARVPA